MHHFISLLYALGFDTNPILCLLGSGLHSRGFYTEEIVSAHIWPRPIIYCTMYIQRFWEVFVSTDTYYIRVGIKGTAPAQNYQIHLHQCIDIKLRPPVSITISLETGTDVAFRSVFEPQISVSALGSHFSLYWHWTIAVVFELSIANCDHKCVKDGL